MKNIKFKKIIKYLPLALLLFLLLDAILPTLFYQPKVNHTPLPGNYQKGVYHLHSTFSDGTGNIQTITQAAASLGLDFVLLTDHGRPNMECVNSTGYYNNVLLIGGSEFSLNCGHLATAGFRIPNYIFPPEPQEAIDEVIKDQGICFVSHPYDRIAWTDWDIKNFTGIEILSAASCAGKLGITPFLRFLLQYTFNEKYALLHTLFYPAQNIAKWNELNRMPGSKYYGIYALDAHAKLALTKKIKFHFPSYQSIFQILTVYIKQQQLSPEQEQQQKTPAQSSGSQAGAKEHAASIISAIREGRFFNVIEAIAPANGFDVIYFTRGGKIVQMGGSTSEIHGVLRVALPFEFATKVVLKKDGLPYLSTVHQPGKTQKPLPKFFDIPIKTAGVYNLEIYVEKSPFSHLPWIITNPFFIAKDSSLPKEITAKKEDEIVEIKKQLVDRENFFNVEKNPASQGVIQFQQEEEDKPGKITALQFFLEKESNQEDFWVCLASRGKYDFTGAKGILFEARFLAGDEASTGQGQRFWFEIRTGEGPGKETWYRHSFVTHGNWRRLVIPFGKMFPFYGEKKKLQLSDIRSLFFSINNSIAYPGARGSVQLKNIGLY